MSDHWDIYFCYYEDKFASVVLDMDIWREIDKNNYSHPLFLRTIVKSPAENGLPINDEAELLNDIEDLIIAEIKDLGYNIGRITCDGNRDVFFYFKEPSLELLLTLAKKHYSQHDYEFKVTTVKEDSPWEFYFEYIYPNKYQVQHIGNRKVVDSLRESGDPLEKPRRIDHWININNLKDKKSIIKKLINLGFIIEPKDKPSLLKKVTNLGLKMVSKNKNNDEKYLQFYRTDLSDFHSINDITDLLVNLLEDYDAELDGWETLALK
ncbi:DUF695 domain-containing protein [Paenibacillus psychroresistens]|uniref:DUF695 domain-containing protein n=1 Tax=Paenibacillus psychroresistens TaxID=1778678 RepID=A0A6B8RJR0_9BACL|nr:DUF695 domain-containing protein [Paenibacillus psychroresistens]QGQ95822.1 DUF695 domain-containing protein [Paenibacillus psychroresistens]